MRVSSNEHAAHIPAILHFLTDPQLLVAAHKKT